MKSITVSPHGLPLGFLSKLSIFENSQIFDSLIIYFPCLILIYKLRSIHKITSFQYRQKVTIISFIQHTLFFPLNIKWNYHIFLQSSSLFASIIHKSSFFSRNLCFVVSNFTQSVLTFESNFNPEIPSTAYSVILILTHYK